MPKLSEWSIERRLSVATLLLVAGQIVGGVWWLATLTSDVRANTSWRVQNAEAVKEAVIRLDERSSYMVEQLRELKDLLRSASPMRPVR